MNIDELYNLDYLSEDVGINPLCVNCSANCSPRCPKTEFSPIRIQ